MTQTPLQFDALNTLLDAHHDAFEKLAQILLEENAKYNLTRIVDPEQIRARHFLDSLTAISVLDALAAETGQPLRVIDIGSGAGFPSLPLAIVRPQWSFCSLEATGKKARFQKHAARELSLENLRVVHGRAEEAARQPAFREQFDAACARALAAMPILTELTGAFVKPAGKTIFWKGSSAHDELDASKKAIGQMGAQFEQMLPYTLPDQPDESPEFSLVVCRKTKPSPSQYPRVFGMIKKKPLG